jgi:hypothetical protein
MPIWRKLLMRRQRPDSRARLTAGISIAASKLDNRDDHKKFDECERARIVPSNHASPVFGYPLSHRGEEGSMGNRALGRASVRASVQQTPLRHSA